MKLGVLGTADIAFRRFLPALEKCPRFEYAGVASREIEKTQPFIEHFGGRGYQGYDALLADETIEAVYIPLPPALHFEWAYKALQAGKHIFMEKPFTTKLEDTKTLIDLARKKNLAVHENYMFLYHNQFAYLQEILVSKKIGDLRQVRISFGFPKRSAEDFRYNKALGGGALLDCGGYTIQLANAILGDTTKVVYSKLNYVNNSVVDIFGSAMLVNDEGITAQVAFGMDNGYKCEVELWGSEGNIIFSRIFTAPVDFKPQVIISTKEGQQVIKLDADDQFLHSIENFGECIDNEGYKENNRKAIFRQSELLNDCMKMEA